jgi:hypothetical protein
LGEPLQLGTTPEAAVLPVVEGVDHAALALMPFTVAAETEPPVTFAYQVAVDERIRRVNVTLDTVRSADLPKPVDQTIFLGLLQLALRSPEPGERLDFSRRELFELLRWTERNDGYARLRAGLHRLAALLITVESEVLSRSGRPYTGQERGSHLVDDYSVGKGRDAHGYVVWGHLVREAFRLGDLKRLDWDLLLALDNPLTGQLYRLLDRVTLSGHQRWEVGWRPLASALGMRAEAYSRPARFRQVLEPHLESLIVHGVIDGVDYQRGGRFVFHVRNYLRVELRRVLLELGVYADAARQLLAGFDETRIMAQADCLRQGGRGRPQSSGGYLTEAIRAAYELRYPDDEAEAFVALWSMLGPTERELHHRAGLQLCRAQGDLFATSHDPTAWPVEFRAVVRFLITWNLDPAEVLRTPATLRALPGA